MCAFCNNDDPCRYAHLAPVRAQLRGLSTLAVLAEFQRLQLATDQLTEACAAAQRRYADWCAHLAAMLGSLDAALRKWNGRSLDADIGPLAHEFCDDLDAIQDAARVLWERAHRERLA